MIQDCLKCDGRGEYHGRHCLVRRLIFGHETRVIRPTNSRYAMDAAVLAIETFLDRGKSHKMSCDIIPFKKLEGKRMSPLGSKAREESVESPVVDLIQQPFKSASTGKIAEALAKAQAEIKNAVKDKNNPFFESTYADLASVWDACRVPLTMNGLSVTQPLSYENNKIMLTTLLLHTSGEWISSQIPVVPVKNDPQSIGSAITYFRRFSLSAIVGVAPTEKPSKDYADDSDDDGNYASGRTEPRSRQNEPPVKSEGPKVVIKPKEDPKKPTLEQIASLFATARQAGYTDNKLREIIQEDYKVSSSKELTLDQFHRLWDEVCRQEDTFENFEDPRMVK